MTYQMTFDLGGGVKHQLFGEEIDTPTAHAVMALRAGHGHLYYLGLVKGWAVKTAIRRGDLSFVDQVMAYVTPADQPKTDGFFKY